MLHTLSLFSQFYFYGFIRYKPRKKSFRELDCQKILVGTIPWYQDLTLDDRNIESLVLPEFIDKLYSMYYSLDQSTQGIFRKAMFLFYEGLSLKSNHPSFSFAAFVTAVETLINYMKPKAKHCKTCGQPVYRVRKGFIDFMKKYGYGSNYNSKSKKFIDGIYGKRSTILHEGQLVNIDLFWDKTKTKQGHDWQESFMHKDLIGLTRVCLINWLLEQNSV